MLFLSILCLLAVTSADATCTSKYQGKPCLGGSQTPSWMGNYFSTGDPCFERNGGHWCFFTTEGNMAPCDPNASGCGGGTPYVPPGSVCDKADVKTQCDNAAYCSYSKEHTMCKYCGTSEQFCKEVCSRVISEQADKDAIVAKHNELRRRVAKGLETKGFNGRGQPSATDMYELKWNDNLAEVAQRWADQCYPTENGQSKAHDTKRAPCGQYDHVGQNMASGASSGPISTPGFDGMIQSWYDEVSDWPATSVGSFDSHANPNGKAVGHYTQVVWGATKEVGCGYVAFNNPEHPVFQGYAYKKLLICNYGTAGNWGGQPLYTAGPTASGCKNGSNDGLCSW